MLIYKQKCKYSYYYNWYLSPVLGKNSLVRNCDKLGDNARILGEFILRKEDSGYLSIGDNFFCQSGSFASIDVQGVSKISIRRGAKLVIGDNVGSSSIIIHCWHSISISNNVNIGAGCMLFDTNFHNIDPVLRTSGDPRHSVKTAPIIIGNNVFIGARSIILKGCTVGTNSVIAAGSVVVCNVPPNEIWGGNPAKFLKKI